MKNDRRAQEQLYKKFYHALMALCIRYAKDRHDAVEVLNDGFLKVFKNIDQYDAAKASLYTWMRRIIINTAIDFLRKKQVYYDMDALLDDQVETGIENEALGKMSGEELEKVIRQLPSATYTVFNLYAIDGFSHREISAMLQISEGTSRWHLSEARRQLKIIIHLMETNS